MLNRYGVFARSALLLSLALPMAAFAEADGCMLQPRSSLHKSEMPLLPPQPLFEGPSHDAPPLGMEPHLPFLRGIELNEAQQDKIFELMHRQAPLLRDQAKAARRSEEELHRLASAEPFSAEKSRTLAQTYGKAQAEMALLRAETEAKVRAILSPAQRQQLQECRATTPSRDQVKHT